MDCVVLVVETQVPQTVSYTLKAQLMHFVCFVFCFLFRAVPTAHGSSQARGQIRTAAAGLRHSHSHA